MKEPLELGVAQMNAWSVQPTLIDFARPVSLETVPVTSSSIPPFGHASGDTPEELTLSKVVVPCPPAHLTVPVVDDEVDENVPPPPVFAVSVQPDSLSLEEPDVVAVPVNLLHDTLVDASAVPANAERSYHRQTERDDSQKQSTHS